jgi:hypothetical protein
MAKLHFILVPGGSICEVAEREGFEPTVLFRYSRFPGVRLKPLSHLSGSRANVANVRFLRNIFHEERSRPGCCSVPFAPITRVWEETMRWVYSARRCVGREGAAHCARGGRAPQWLDRLFQRTVRKHFYFFIPE